MDSLSRTAFFTAFMFSKDGCLDAIFIVSAYYGIFGLLLIFHLIFNTDRPTFSLQYTIGITMNSLTSVLTFNSFSFEFLAKKKRRSRPPTPTLVKQLAYNLLFLVINLGLTIGTVLHISGWSLGIDSLNGMSRGHLQNLLLTGWSAYCLSGVLTLAFYKVHPSGVDCTLEDTQKKMTYYLCGRKKVMWKNQNEDWCCSCNILSCFKQSHCCSSRCSKRACCTESEEATESTELQQFEDSAVINVEM